MSKLIPLTKGKFAIVDDWNYEWLSQWKWYAKKGDLTYYAKREGKDGQNIWMHRLIMNTPNGKETDHINGNGLDNKQSNMRICTRLQNAQNRRVQQKGTVSGYKGISISGRAKKWQARITINGIRKSLGYFRKAKEAARAYDKAAREYFGEFAKTNFKG